jgi:hypothetical protein
MNHQGINPAFRSPFVKYTYFNYCKSPTSNFSDRYLAIVRVLVFFMHFLRISFISRLGRFNLQIPAHIARITT